LEFVKIFRKVEATGVKVEGSDRKRRRTRSVAKGFATIAQGIEFGKKVFLDQLLAGEQLQRTSVNLGRYGPALAGELLLDHGVEVNREAGDHYEAHQAERERPAKPGAKATGRRCLTGTGRSGTSNGGGLYALY